ncbi:MAG: S41 family peptidase [Lachnospiraceae bacterium]|nr:S41 family peptidase [Lachnospiraceae bacterium]
MDKKTFIKGVVVGIGSVALLFTGVIGFKTINACFGNNSFLPSEKVNAISMVLDKYYVEDIDTEKMEEGMYKGFVSALGDPYTIYLSKAELESFYEDNEGSFIGIGVEVTVDKEDMKITVVTPIPGSPAETAGILSGDKIIKVNGVSVSGNELSDAISTIRGEVNTDVTVTIYRESTRNTFDVTLTRSNISESTVKYEMKDGNIGYIKISQFKKNTYDQFIEAYNDLNNMGQKGLIIDLRNNPGGLFDVVGNITDELVPEGTYVYTIDKQGTRVDKESDAECINIPLCLLVNENSASASEILSGAVQDMGVGKLVGTKTFGKGLVQGIYPLGDGSGIKITIQKYYTPRGVCIQGEGITPDYIVELPDTISNPLLISPEEDIQLQKAVEVISLSIKK